MGLGLIAGAPAILGAVIGASVYSQEVATFLIGMASATRPGNGDASIFAYGTPPLYAVPIRIPGGTPDAPTGLTILQ